jgi:hypothetical protein
VAKPLSPTYIPGRRRTAWVKHDQPTAVRTIASALQLEHTLRAQWRPNTTSAARGASCDRVGQLMPRAAAPPGTQSPGSGRRRFRSGRAPAISARSSRVDSETSPDRPTGKRFESSVGRLLRHESASAGPLADRRESDDRQAARGRTVGAGVVPAFMPKQNSAPVATTAGRTTPRVPRLASSRCFPTHGSRPAWVLGRGSNGCIWLLGGATRTVRQAMASGGRRDSPQ